MSSKLPQIHLVYNRYKKASLTRKAVVEIRISYNYKQKYISTGVWLYSNQWKDGKIINCENILHIRQVLEKMVTDVRKVLFEMMEEGDVDIFAVPSRIKTMNNKETSFLEFCQQRAAIRKYSKEKDTQERYDRFLRLFSEWGKIKKFEDVKESNIISYDKFLLKKGMRDYSKWNNYHRFLNSFIMDAIDEGLLTRNPYKWININKGYSDGGISKCLTPAELEKVINAKMPTPSLERVRDLFVFQTYTCLRYSDLALFDMKYIHDIKGMKVYIRNSKKTKKQFTVPILPMAWDILMKYKGHLPIISNVLYNLYLKAVAQTANLDKPLSTHWARHTGATLLLNEGVDMRIISKICGHSSVKITEQVYAKLLDETVVDALSKLKENL